MKRALTLAVLAVILAATPAAAVDQQEVRERQCRYQWMDPGIWTAREEYRTARCVLERWNVPGGFDTFHRIIACESGWRRTAWR